MKKVFVSGCYDLLHSGHVEFFRQASQYGDLYVGIGSDQTILGYKHHKTFYPEQERLFMVKSIKYVKDAYINQGWHYGLYPYGGYGEARYLCGECRWKQ